MIDNQYPLQMIDTMLDHPCPQSSRRHLNPAAAQIADQDTHLLFTCVHNLLTGQTQPSRIASNRHRGTHAPHPEHFSSSIRIASSNTIASFGQTETQVPHRVHKASSTTAIGCGLLTSAVCICDRTASSSRSSSSAWTFSCSSLGAGAGPALVVESVKVP